MPVALSGHVVDQFTGAPLVNIAVRFGPYATVPTDLDGRFTVPGEPSIVPLPLTLTGFGIFERRALAVSGDAEWRVVPAEFQMPAFDDLCRESGYTKRWTQTPKLYLNSRPRGTGIADTDLARWIAEVSEQAPYFVSAWTDGMSATLTVTDSPPPNYASGTIVIHFSELASDYGDSAAIGWANYSSEPSGAITGGYVHLRYRQYRDNPGKRRGILGHELGHTLGYHHMDMGVSSFMERSLGSKTDLKPFDHLAARFMYDRPPRCASPDTIATTKRRGRK